MATALDSPCLGVCVIDARTDTCFGCFRAPKEIARWPRWGEEDRRATLKKLKQRRKDAGLPPLAFYEEIEDLQVRNRSKREGPFMDDRIFHLFADGPAPVAPYSHAVSAGDFLFVTGQLPTGQDDDPIPDSIEDQTHKVMANLKTVLAGCDSSLADVVSVRIFLTRFEEEYDRMNAVYETYFPADRRPARTTVGVTALARGCRVEIDLIAKRGG